MGTPEYEINCVAQVIRGKEARGMDASFERDLLKSWAKYPDYSSAADVLKGLCQRQDGREGVAKPITAHKPLARHSSKLNVAKPLNKGGRPRKDVKRASRWTKYRRKKERQGALI